MRKQEMFIVGMRTKHQFFTTKRVGLAALWASIPFLLLACGAVAPAHKHTEPFSASEHETQAKEHEAQAEVTENRVEPQGSGDEVQCIDTGGPLESGGERMPVMRPCWTKAELNSTYKRAADRQRAAANDHRKWARLLVEAEAEACQTLPQSERETSPFTRTADILSVVEYQEHGKVMGAKVTFRKVPGLTKAWFQSSIRCHQARAAKLGYDEAYMTHCPLVLKQVGTSIEEGADTLVVTLRSTDPIIAVEIYGRALRFLDGDTDTDATVKKTQ